MAQPEIPGTDIGRPVMPYGSNAAKWIALLVDALGRLQVDAEVGNFPADPTTQTTLALCLAELEDVIKHANLQIIGTTKCLAVCSDKGDKILSLESTLAERDEFTLAGGSDRATSDAVPANRVWFIGAVAVRNTDRAVTYVRGGIFKNSTPITLMTNENDQGIDIAYSFAPYLYLAAGEKLYFDIGDGQNGNLIRIGYSGYQMNEP